ncbi:MAG: hypothetical protein A2045_05450 [Rhodocyclales bacterium GWA2_65_20]|nr:MAG: hypothetical protein A2045_05450 [Rhodocyclales bacterium GWA2_65_20]
MKLDICRDFDVRETATGLVVVTPLQYDDGDQVVVFADTVEGDGWRVHDNGESAFRLSLDHIDVESERIQRWLGEHSSRVGWNEADEQFELLVSDGAQLVPAAFKIAQAAVQMQSLSALRVTRSESSFKAEVIELLKGVQHETGVEAEYDVAVDTRGLLIADCIFRPKEHTVAFFVASTKERLLEAELSYLALKQEKRATRVIAVVEAIAAVGQKQYSRAEFFTSKVFPFREFEEPFRGWVQEAASGVIH